jgi:hypothetical protein
MPFVGGCGKQARGAMGIAPHVRCSLRMFDLIAIGGTRFRSTALAISELPVFASIGMDRAPAMIVGLATIPPGGC